MVIHQASAIVLELLLYLDILLVNLGSDKLMQEHSLTAYAFTVSISIKNWLIRINIRNRTFLLTIEHPIVPCAPQHMLAIDTLLLMHVKPSRRIIRVGFQSLDVHDAIMQRYVRRRTISFDTDPDVRIEVTEHALDVVHRGHVGILLVNRHVPFHEITGKQGLGRGHAANQCKIPHQLVARILVDCLPVIDVAGFRHTSTVCTHLQPDKVDVFLHIVQYDIRNMVEVTNVQRIHKPVPTTDDGICQGLRIR